MQNPFKNQPAGQSGNNSLDKTIEKRTALARKLAANAKQRGELLAQGREIDAEITAARVAGLVSENAVAGRNYGGQRIQQLLDLEDRRAGIPGAASWWIDGANIPSLVAEFERDHKTMRS